MTGAGDRWDWTTDDPRASPALLGSLAAARYRSFRAEVEASETVDNMRFGLLLAVENARDDLRALEDAPPLVRLAGTSDEARRVRSLHGALDVAVIVGSEGRAEEINAKWADAVEDERRARVDWYLQWLNASGLEGEIATEPQQEEALTLLLAAIRANESTETLMKQEVEVMELAFERVAHASNLLVLATPHWLVSPLAVGESFGLSRWGNQHMATDPNDLAATERVWKAAAIWIELNHPHIVKFLGACHVGDLPFVVHESAQPLVQSLKDRGRVQHRRSVWRLLHEIALALRFVHENGYAVEPLTVDVLCLAPFEDVALLRSMDLVPLGDSRPHLRAFGTCIVDLWRELYVHARGPGSLEDRNALEQLGTPGQFPVESPDFFLASEWDLLERIGRADSEVTFREVIDGLGKLAELERRTDADISISSGSATSSWAPSYVSLSVEKQTKSTTDTAPSPNPSTGGTSIVPPPPWSISSGNLRLEEQLGKGSFAVAYKAKWFDAPVVVKHVPARGSVLSDKQRAECRREAGIWFALNHMDVVKMFGACEGENSFQFVCELAEDGTLDKFLASDERHKYFSFSSQERVTMKDQAFVWKHLLDAALGLQYLHRVGIVHGDLKLNNILVGSRVAKLTDFGLSLRTQDDNSSSGGAIGAYRWKAPECLPAHGKPGKPATFASDVFSFAMCMVEAVTGEPPWGTMDDGVVKFHVKHGSRLSQPSAMPDPEWAVIERMTSPEPGDRVAMDAVVAHLFAKVVEMNLDLGYRDQFVSADDNQVLARPQALMALASLATSNNQSVAVTAINFVSMVQGYRLYSSAERREVDAVLALFQDKRDRVVEWAVTAVGHLAFRSKANRAMIRDAGGISHVVTLLTSAASAASDCSRHVAATLYALEGLAVDAESICAAVEAGAIPPLCTLLQHGHHSSDDTREYVHQSAARVFGNLVAVESRQRKSPIAGSVIPSLMAMLIDGVDNEKAIATVALMNLTTGREHCDAIVQANAIPALVSLLESKDAELRQSTAGLLVNLSALPKYRLTVADSGAIPPLISILGDKSGSPSEKENAAKVLANVAADPKFEEIRERIAKAGAIPSLVRMLESGTSGEKTYSAAVLIVLATSEARSDEIVREGCIPALVTLLKGGTEVQRENAVWVLQNLSLSDANEVAIAKADAIGPLLWMLERGNEVQKEKAACVLANLAHNEHNKVEIAASGGIALLTALLRDGTEIQQEVAVRGLRNISVGGEYDVEIAASGAIDLLVQCLRASNPGLNENAAVILAALSQSPAVMQRVVAAGSIPPLVALLKGGTAGQQYAAVSALACFSERGENHAAFANARAIVPLLQLAESDGDPQEAAVTTVANLANTTGSAREILAARGVSLLASLLKNPTQLYQAFVVAALGNLAIVRPTETSVEIAKEGVILVLAKLMERDDNKPVRTKVRDILSKVSTACGRSNAIGMTAAIPALVHLASDERLGMGEFATAALASLTFVNAPARSAAIVALGGVDALVSLLQCPTPSRTRSNAAAALMNLATRPAIKPALWDSGAIAVLMRMSEGSDRKVDQDLSALAMENMFANAKHAAQVVLKHDGSWYGLHRRGQRPSSQSVMPV